jgi:hypothetical protein
MRTYIVNEPLHAIGPIKSHMIQKMMCTDDSLFVKFTCGWQTEYLHLVGVDLKLGIFYVRNGKEIRIFPASRCRATHRCMKCSWPEEPGFQAFPKRVEVVCWEGSDMEHFVKLFDYSLLSQYQQVLTAAKGHI